jgi:hypothetical protein
MAQQIDFYGPSCLISGISWHDGRQNISFSTISGAVVSIFGDFLARWSAKTSSCEQASRKMDNIYSYAIFEGELLYKSFKGANFA